MPKIVGTGVENRTRAFLKKYWHNYNQWDKNSQNIKTEVLVCIAWADSHLWYALKTKNNVGNIGNTDSWKTMSFDTLDQWIRAISNTLNNRYLGTKQIIWDLSFAGNCKTNCSKVYATSNQNRENNVLNCLSLIHQEQVTSYFKFRR